MDTLGDIKLNGKNYRIDVGTYRDRDVVDFAPRSGTPGGSIIHSQLGIYQPLLQTDWRHGLGHHWYADEFGYLNTTGNIDTRHRGIVMMFTDSTSSDTDNEVKEGFTTWNSILWAWGAAGLRRYASGWTEPYSTGAVNFALAAGDYLYYCPDGARIQKVSTADAHTDTGNDSNSIDYKWLIPFNGFIYAGKDGTNRIHRDSTSDMSKLEGLATDTDVIYIGTVEDAFPTLGAIVYATNLYISRADGLWHLGEDLIARRILDFSSEASSDNFRSMTVYNGYLLFPIRDKIYQWNGARLTDVTPPHISDSFPYTTYGRFDNLVSMGRFLYMTARTNESTYNEDLLCFDGVSWHKLARLVTNGADSITAMGYDSVNNYLWYHKDATADISYYIEFQSQSEFPYADFPTSGTHEIEMSRWDMGYRWVTKSSPTLVIEASNCTSARYLEIYYSLDGGTYTSWSDENITSDGTTKLTNPGGLQSVEYKYIKIKIRFITDAVGQSPILEGMTLRFIMRPDEIYGWSMNIPIALGLEIGESIQTSPVKKIMDNLKDARNNKSPIEFIDIFGDRHLVYLTSLTRQAVELDRDEGGMYPNVEHMVSINLVQAA